MRSTTSAQRSRGFTLVEVLVALAIVALTLAAASRSVAVSTVSGEQHRLRVLAGFVADNHMAELAARRAWPGVGVSEGVERQAGIEFRWRAEVFATPHPRLRRVEVQVLDPDDPGHELRRVVGVLFREF
jgi:general secretion pathway protein I